jgi:hypothetical protein
MDIANGSIAHSLPSRTRMNLPRSDTKTATRANYLALARMKDGPSLPVSRDLLGRRETFQLAPSTYRVLNQAKKRNRMETPRMVLQAI